MTKAQLRNHIMTREQSRKQIIEQVIVKVNDRVRTRVYAQGDDLVELQVQQSVGYQINTKVWGLVQSQANYQGFSLVYGQICEQIRNSQ